MIKKTLVFQAPYPHNRTLVWDVSDPHLRGLAYVDLFKILDSELDAYGTPDAVVCALIGLARSGNPEAAEALLCYRRNHVGEKFEEIEVRLPSPNLTVLLDPMERVNIKVAAPEELWDGEKGMLPPIEALERSS
jgi:hypothetical protein